MSLSKNNEEYRVTLADATWAERIFELWKKCPSLWETATLESDQEQTLPEDTLERIQRLLTNPNVKYWVVTLGDELVASFGSRAWKSLPYYTLIELKSSLTQKPFEFKKVFSLLLEVIITANEEEGRHTFFFVASYRQFYNRNERGESGASIIQDFFPHTKDYVFTTEAICKKGEYPEWENYRSLLGYRPPKTDVIIRRGTKILRNIKPS